MFIPIILKNWAQWDSGEVAASIWWDVIRTNWKHCVDVARGIYDLWRTSEGSVDIWKQCLVVPTLYNCSWHSVAVFSTTQMTEKGTFVGKGYHMMFNNQGSATVSLTLNQEHSIKQLCFCPLGHSALGVSVLKVCNT